MERELLKGNTPTLVLVILRDGPLHGYAIAREIERRSNNALRLKEGTLYPVLHELERGGLVAADWETDGGKRKRKTYRLTPTGVRAAAQRAREWRDFVAAMQGVLGGVTDGQRDEPESKPDRGRRLQPEPAR